MVLIIFLLSGIFAIIQAYFDFFKSKNRFINIIVTTLIFILPGLITYLGILITNSQNIPMSIVPNQPDLIAHENKQVDVDLSSNNSSDFAKQFASTYKQYSSDKATQQGIFNDENHRNELAYTQTYGPAFKYIMGHINNFVTEQAFYGGIQITSASSIPDIPENYYSTTTSMIINFIKNAQWRMNVVAVVPDEGQILAPHLVVRFGKGILDVKPKEGTTTLLYLSCNTLGVSSTTNIYWFEYTKSTNFLDACLLSELSAME